MMTFFKLVCCWSPKATTRGFAGQRRKNASTSSRQILFVTFVTDIRPYYKKLLDTSTALLQEVTLQTNFMLRKRVNARTGLPSTVKSF
jgi:hypothetical protein